MFKTRETAIHGVPTSGFARFAMFTTFPNRSQLMPFPERKGVVNNMIKTDRSNPLKWSPPRS
jgi:hypothetical protein